MSQYDTTFDLKINVGHCHQYFMVQWFCLISWRLFDIWTPYFGIMSQYVWPKNECRTLWPIFYGPVIFPCILKTIWYMNTILWDYESVWADVWPKNKCRSLWPIFHGPVILPYILTTIWYLNTYFGIIVIWPEVWPKNKCNCDLYLFQWFCLIEDYLIYETYPPISGVRNDNIHQWTHTLGLWVSMSWCLTSK